MSLTYENLADLDLELFDEAEKVRVRYFDGDYKSDEEIFYDACFCILAPQAKFANNLAIVNDLKERDFFKCDVPIEELAWLCKRSRFYNVKAKRLRIMKANFPDMLEIVKDTDLSTEEKRCWLVHNVKGFGMKAASHFLRNLGEDDLAILDTHVFKFLKCEPPKNRAEYYDLEEKLRKIAKKHEINMTNLDLIIWQHYADVTWEEYVY